MSSVHIIYHLPHLTTVNTPPCMHPQIAERSPPKLARERPSSRHLSRPKKNRRPKRSGASRRVQGAIAWNVDHGHLHRALLWLSTLEKG